MRGREGRRVRTMSLGLLACVLLLILPSCGAKETTAPSDTTPPAVVTNLVATVVGPSEIQLVWTAPGDDGNLGRATQYDIRYSATPLTEGGWGAATPLAAQPTSKIAGSGEVAVVSGLTPQTTYYFALKAADEAPNWSALSNVAVGTTSPAADVTAPAAAVLAVGSPTTTSLTLTWTAPGDDGNTGTASQYDVRYATGAGTSWDFMTQATGEPTPPQAGQSESFTVASLSPNTTYYFAMRAADEAPNWSALSNVAVGSTSPAPDLTAPAAVMLVVGSPTSTSLTLTWAAPGDDGNTGTASQYDMRYATSSGTSWDLMTHATGEPTPQAAGQPESLSVTGLSPSMTYYFLLKTADEVPNWSVASNEPSGTTIAAGPVPGNMVLVPAGTFTMGDGVASCGTSQHQVTLTHSFYLGQYEVTNQEYRDAVQWAYDQGYVTATSSTVQDNLDGSTVTLVDLSNFYCQISFEGGTFTVDPGKEDCPIAAVSWYGAAAYCDWLSVGAGLARAYSHSTWQCNGGSPYAAAGYRLPTDAEWECAAQYGDERIYPWGNDSPSCGRANYSGCVGSASAVGSCAPASTSLGLYDVAGNVSEWCDDWHACDLGTSSQADPTGPASGSYRVLHGGSWYAGDGYLRCSCRSYYTPSITGGTFGVRCVRSQ